VLPANWLTDATVFRWQTATSTAARLTLAHSSKLLFRLLCFGIVPANLALTSGFTYAFIQVQLDGPTAGDNSNRVQLARLFAYFQPLALTAVNTTVAGSLGSMWYFGGLGVVVPILVSIRSDLSALASGVLRGTVNESQLRTRLVGLRREIERFNSNMVLQQLLFTVLGAAGFFMCALSVILLNLDPEIAVSLSIWAVMTVATASLLLYTSSKVHSVCSIDLLQACALRGTIAHGGLAPPPPLLDANAEYGTENALADTTVVEVGSSAQLQLDSSPRQGAPSNEQAAWAGARRRTNGEPSDPQQASATTGDHHHQQVEPFSSDLLHWVDVVSRHTGIFLGGVVLVTPPLLGTAASLVTSVLILLANNSPG